MRTEQLHWRAHPHGTATWPSPQLPDATLVFCFGSNDALRESSCFSELKRRYPKAYIAGCSTAGEVRDVEVHEDSVVATAVEFASTKVSGCTLSLADVASSQEAGQLLAKKLNKEGLVHVLVLSDGLAVNGSALALGMSEALPDGVAVTGGLSADGEDFHHTQ